MEGTPYAIVGVASPSMDFPTGTQLWTPLLPFVSRSLLGVAKYKFLNVVGRLGAGVTAARVHGGPRRSHRYRATQQWLGSTREAVKSVGHRRHSYGRSSF